MTQEQVAWRRPVEALRSGVPSWDAVSELGSGQTEVEDRFTALLDAAEGGAAGGLLLGAGFGAGKSHVLTHLSALALERSAVVRTPSWRGGRGRHGRIRRRRWSPSWR